MSYKIAFSRMATGKLPPGDPRWGEFTTSFVNHELEVVDIANYIYLGHAYCAWLKGGRRNSENFQLAQHIAIDLDTEDERSHPDTLENHWLVKAYGGMIHTSPSHRPDAPRSRVVFFLDRPIETGEGYRKAYETVAAMFEGADTVCKDPARFFYGAKDCDLRLVLRELPVAHIRTMYKQFRKEQPRAVAQQQVGIVRLEDYRKPAETGEVSTAEEVRAALACIMYRPDYEEWRNICWSVAASVGDETAERLLMEWRAEESQGEYGRVLRSDRGKGIGAGTLFYLARQNGYKKAVG